LSDDELREKICAAVKDYDHSLLKGSFDDLNESIGHDKGSTDIGQVALAAQEGRVKELFVHPGYEYYGRITLNEREVDVHDSRQPGDEELTDFTIRHAALTDAKIHILDSEEHPLPGKAHLAASFRY
jgi:hypothetical protein